METNEEKAKEIADNLLGSLEYQSGAEEGAQQMAQCKDEQFKGFLFELALKITTPKTDFDKALASAFPMAGLDTIDDVLALLQNNWYDYQNKGTILNE